MLKVMVLTETRADYGIYYPLLHAMSRDDRFELMVVATGMHLEEDCGFSWDMVKSDFPEARAVDYPFSAALFAEKQPDWLVVLGDRRPMLEAAIGAAYLNIPVAHLFGGDISGTIDGPARHAITRFAHLHFAATRESADRLLKMGEEAWRITIIGPLGIYSMPEADFKSRRSICQELGLDAEREIILILQHPVHTEQSMAGWQMEQTLKAVASYQAVVIYPNNDPGSREMVEVIEKWSGPKCKNLPYLDFLSLLKTSSVIIGNSSTGLYEAPLFGVPAVDIGSRQAGRQRGTDVLSCGYDATEIGSAIEYHLRTIRPFFDGNRNPFDKRVDGIKLILTTLAETGRDAYLLQKRLTY